MTAEEYGKLGFGSRLALMGLELKGARGETVTAEERNAAIEKSKEGGAFGGLIGGLGAALEKFLGKIGFDVDGDGNPFSSSRIKNPETGEWEDPITDKVTNKADGTEITEDKITYDTKGNAPFTDSKKPTGTIFSSPTRSPDLYQDQMFMGRAETPVAPTPTTLNTSPLRPYIDPIYDEIGRGTPTSKQRLEGIKETLKFLEKDASNLRNQNLNRTSKTVNKKRDDEARQRRRDKKRSFADAADKKTTKIIAKRGRRDQDKVDKADKDIKDRLKEASKTGTLRLKKGGLMKKNYP